MGEAHQLVNPEIVYRQNDELAAAEVAVTAINGVKRSAARTRKKPAEPSQNPEKNEVSFDNGVSDAELLDIYMRAAKTHPLLTKDQETKLAKEIEAGREAAERLKADKELEQHEREKLENAVANAETARELFIVSNLKLVVSATKRYNALNFSRLDLIQEGNIGLMHAVEKFDYRRGFKFSTYASWWIQHELGKYIASNDGAVRLPPNIDNKRRQIRAAISTLASQPSSDGRTDKQIAGITRIPVELVVRLLRLESVASLEEPVGDGNTTLGEMLGNVEEGYGKTDKKLLGKIALDALSRLDEIERDVLVLYFGLDGVEQRTFREVGELLGITPGRANYVTQKALAKLRRSGQGLNEIYEEMFG